MWRNRGPDAGLSTPASRGESTRRSHAGSSRDERLLGRPVVEGRGTMRWVADKQRERSIVCKYYVIY
jgi:hypothetical protein